MFVLHTLYEAYSGRHDILKKIDNVFSELKKTKYDKTAITSAKKSLKLLLTEFTGIKKIHLDIEKAYENASVFAFYNSILPRDLNITKIITGETIDIPKTGLAKDEENAKYISELYVLIGLPIIDIMTPKQCTAILLHELGHVFLHTSNLPGIIEAIVGFIIPKLKFITAVNAIRFGAIIPATLKIMVPIYLFACVLSRTLRFTEHRAEYESDKFATKYGYGEEMVSVFKKFEKMVNGPNAVLKESWWKVIANFITEFFIYNTTHPSNTNRACDVIKIMKEKYQDKYPEMKDAIERASKNVEC